MLMMIKLIKMTLIRTKRVRKIIKMKMIVISKYVNQE